MSEALNARSGTRRQNSPLKAQGGELDVFDNYPEREKAPPFLLEKIAEYAATRIGDIGGGAHPMIGLDQIGGRGLDYTVLDISETELAKAGKGYKKLAVDMTAEPGDFNRVVPPGSFDLVFSHMFLEHIREPDRVHRNIWSMLRPGGIAIHMFPSPNNIPLGLNLILPERVSRTLLRIAHPFRDLDGMRGKFPAYYKLCGAPAPRLTKKFESFGFEVLEHKGYVGHTYYSGFPVLRDIERMSRRPIAALSLPWISKVLLILEKPKQT